VALPSGRWVSHLAGPHCAANLPNESCLYPFQVPIGKDINSRGPESQAICLESAHRGGYKV
jgi:hypothetical protein